MSWFKKLLAKPTASETASKAGAFPEPKPAKPILTQEEVKPTVEGNNYVLTRSVDDPLYDATFKARDTYWKSIGSIDEDVIAHMVSPQFMGMPAWPTTRQAYKVIRTETTLIIASDGLSDPFTDCEEHKIHMNGFGGEVFIETADLVDASFDEITKSWHYETIEIWARNVAHYGGLNARLEKYGVMSMELPIQSAPSDLKNEHGNVGFLVNCKMAQREYEVSDAPLSPIKIISLMAIKPDELKFIVEGGQDARNSLVNALGKKGYIHLNNSTRKSVIE